MKIDLLGTGILQTRSINIKKYLRGAVRCMIYALVVPYGLHAKHVYIKITMPLKED